ALVIFWFGFHYYVILPIFNHTTFSYCNIEEIFSKRFAVLSLCIFSLWRILFLWLGRFGSSSQISYAKLTLECLFSLMNVDDMFATFATRCIRIEINDLSQSNSTLKKFLEEYPMENFDSGFHNNSFVDQIQNYFRICFRSSSNAS
ncbi:hypothetical protein DERF_007544, partial [Dermatophagoides farinae]